VEPAHGESDVRVGLPHLANGPVPRAGHFLFGGPALGLRQLHTELGSPALENVPLESEPHAVAWLGGTEPPGRLISSGDFDPAGKRVDVGYQRECREIGCARSADLRFLSA